MNRIYRIASSLILSALFFFPACGGGGGGGSGTQPPPPFFQSDLTGNWYVSILQTSPTLTSSTEPGWIRGMATVYSSGSISIPTLETNLGSGIGPVGVVWTIDPSSGIISEFSGNPDFHGKLAANKQLIVGTATNLDSTPTTTPVQLRIIQKIASSATYTISDIANMTFMIHQIESGEGSDWMYADGFTGPVFSGLTTTATLTTITKPTGTTAGGPVGLLSIDPSGIVSLSTNSSFKGIMSQDKTYIVATETALSSSNNYRLTIIQMTGQTFNISDLAGSWHFHGLIGGISAWIYQSVSINSLGLATITSQLTSRGTGTIPSPVTLTIDGSGIVAQPLDTTFHGTMSWNKDMLVSTQTITDGGSFFNMLGVTIK